jgi:hypothetical protein
MGESVAVLRTRAQGLQAPESWDAVASLSISAHKEERMVAGYALTGHLLAGHDGGGKVATDLVDDEEWEVREAAAFGVRSASVRDFTRVLPLLRCWAESSSSRQHRALLVVARQTAKQGKANVAALMPLVKRCVADRDPYVKKNVAFALRHLARTQPDSLLGLLSDLSVGDEHDAWCATKGLTPALFETRPVESGAIVRALRGRRSRTVARALRAVDAEFARAQGAKRALR